MYVYAGIDEAGYGPMLGPMLIGRSVFVMPEFDAGGPPPPLWQRLDKAVCRNLAQRKGRIPVNDSKKLHSQSRGVQHLELGCLSFAALADKRPTCLGSWLSSLGERCHEDLSRLPWYAPTADHPWNPLPIANTEGQIAVARGLLTTTAGRVGILTPDLGVVVVFEDRFNHMVSMTRSKAAASFTFVAGHLMHIWREFGEHEPLVAVDRQSGRMRYRELLALNFPHVSIRVLEETPERSTYYLTGPPGKAGSLRRSMRVSFEVDADRTHMPVALASMIAKYTRELLMERFNAYFTRRIPSITPTAGYLPDARRFCSQIEPHLPTLNITLDRLCRTC